MAVAGIGYGAQSDMRARVTHARPSVMIDMAVCEEGTRWQAGSLVNGIGGGRGRCGRLWHAAVFGPIRSPNGQPEHASMGTAMSSCTYDAIRAQAHASNHRQECL